ncbi:hypothetical protein OROMI_007045 [Orobanche minor]
MAAAASSMSINSRTCYCKKEVPLRIAKTKSNRGQKFYGCGNFFVKGEAPCNYFEWAGNTMIRTPGMAAPLNVNNTMPTAESTHISYDQTPSQPTQASAAANSPAHNTRSKKRAAETKKTLGARRRLVKK